MYEGERSKYRDRIIIRPGEFRISREPLMLSTLLGSCVAVCMYDPVAGVMGMNHFLIATRQAVQQGSVLTSDAGRYGIHAMELLINGLLKLGASRSRLRAKAFGGGNVLVSCTTQEKGFVSVNIANARFVREFLEEDGIPLEAADLGGNFGRQIHFDGTDYSVYVRKIHMRQSGSIVQAERQYWGNTLHEVVTQTEFLS